MLMYFGTGICSVTVMIQDDKFLRKLWVGATRLAKHRAMTLCLIGFLSFGGSWLWAIARGMPVPQIQDEFSYLLAGDTFAHGRLTNPTPPLWEHFETYHELMRPTYMSKYPPAQGFFIALGNILFKSSIHGVWLSAALMCMAVTWMLYAWVAPAWALLGGLLTVMQFGIFTYWTQSYWGGAVAALAGAMMGGALPRICQYQRLRDVLWFGLGFMLTVNSRPLEGVLLGLPMMALLLPWRLKQGMFAMPRFFTKVLVPLCCVLLMNIGFFLFYNKSVTGDSLMPPHRLYAKQYTSLPIFTFQPLGQPVTFNHKVMEDFDNRWGMAYFNQKKTLNGALSMAKDESLRIARFFVGYPLGIVAMMSLLFLLMKRRRMLWRVLLAGSMLVFIVGATYCRVKAHYYASLTGMVVLAMAIGLRALFFLKNRYGYLGRIILVIVIGYQVLLDIDKSPVFPKASSWGVLISGPFSIMDPLPLNFSREDFRKYLLRQPGRHLVLVQYAPNYYDLREWVYNNADLEQSRIIWARSINKEKDDKLIEYFKGRTVWTIQLQRIKEFRYDAR